MLRGGCIPGVHIAFLVVFLHRQLALIGDFGLRLFLLGDGSSSSAPDHQGPPKSLLAAQTVAQGCFGKGLRQKMSPAQPPSNLLFVTMTLSSFLVSITFCEACELQSLLARWYPKTDTLFGKVVSKQH